jgi:glutathione peroxidase
MPSLYDLSVLDARSERVSLAKYRDKVLLIVNTASRCGFTPQYAGLQELYERYRGRGFELLAFPCDQFGHQEPGTNQEIQAFCETRFAVTFPVFDKLDVNGPGASPLFGHLKAAAPGIFGTRRIKWNFTKFLVSRDGQRVRRYAPRTAPKRLESDLEQLLQESVPPAPAYDHTGTAT